MSDQISQPLNNQTDAVANDVKMVIWDLDDTFWDGTLAEGGITFIERNATLVKELAGRGIISSIVSKNAYEAAKKILEQEGIWEYFVFPSISYDPKGKRVAEIIENAAFRPENVLLIDDNRVNLEEARYFNNGIMLAHPGELLPIMLDHPRLAGKPDPQLKRLKQYQLLQRKFIDQQSANLSNEDFLRASKIEIQFDYDVDANLDRIVDLINRANQLNYTKKRLRTAEEIEAFRLGLNEYGMSAACISCSDRYGNYGIIGFYALKTGTSQKSLHHFVFSCRTMNMGIEQFVFEHLGRPEITIAPDVAYGLDSHTMIDWVRISESIDQNKTPVRDDLKLLLVGGCELLQLSSFCSSKRAEFVNQTGFRDDGSSTRYDDPSFILANREILRDNDAIREVSGWTYDDAVRLDRSIAESKIIILAMRAVLRHLYVVARESVYIRMTKNRMDKCILKNPRWFSELFSIVKLDIKKRLDLIGRAFERVKTDSTADVLIFVLGANLRTQTNPFELRASISYNDFCRRFCQENSDKFYFVDVNGIVPENSLVDPDHFNRFGYYEIAKHIMNIVSLEEAARVGCNRTTRGA